eukprot:TRINITY_DN959_c0_g4_i1.p1 TRINITY_DN959_c0_g4~~TRINITY_DN959_c0_g4_i1.p1  ORF type:complete len:114 (-),score=9.07 TRINITY_DN959_c0_g4_i1:467-808(-)
MLTFLYLLACIFTETFAQDLLSGNGRFTAATLQNWRNNLSASDSISIYNDYNNTPFLVYTRQDKGDLNFYAGLSTTFTESKAKHIRFTFASTSVNAEDTNLRIKDSVIYLSDL